MDTAVRRLSKSEQLLAEFARSYRSRLEAIGCVASVVRDSQRYGYSAVVTDQRGVKGEGYDSWSPLRALELAYADACAKERTT
jgi:hypothetical protein